MEKNRYRLTVGGRAFSETVKQAAAGRWSFLLQGIGIDAGILGGKHHPCPGCGGKDRFQLTVRGAGSEWGRFSCRGHDKGGGDGFALVQHVLGCSFPEAVQHVASLMGLGDTPRQTVMPRLKTPATTSVDHSEAERLQRSLAVVHRLWGEAQAITPDDAAAIYLDARGLADAAPYSESLRFHPSLQHWAEDGTITTHPALLCHVSNAAGQLIALQRIYLKLDGRKADVDSPKKLIKGADLAGACVRLGLPIEGRLCVSEGVETALAVQVLTGVPCWAGVTAWGLQSMAIPPSVLQIYIMGDNDTAGIKAAHALKDRLRGSGHEAFVKMPVAPTGYLSKGYDWLDELNRLQKEGQP